MSGNPCVTELFVVNSCETLFGLRDRMRSAAVSHDLKKRLGFLGAHYYVAAHLFLAGSGLNRDAATAFTEVAMMTVHSCIYVIRTYHELSARVSAVYGNGYRGYTDEAWHDSRYAGLLRLLEEHFPRAVATRVFSVLYLPPDGYGAGYPEAFWNALAVMVQFNTRQIVLPPFPEEFAGYIADPWGKMHVQPVVHALYTYAVHGEPVCWLNLPENREAKSVVRMLYPESPCASCDAEKVPRECPVYELCTAVENRVGKKGILEDTRVAYYKSYAEAVEKIPPEEKGLILPF